MKGTVKRVLKQHFLERVRDTYWDLYGVRLKNPVFTEHPKTFLFVCRGNVCRSPFAEHLAREISGGKGGKFCSAGLDVQKSLPPPNEAVLAAKDFGVDLDEHRSRAITPMMMEEFDVVLAMDAGHFTELRNAYPESRHKVFLLPLCGVNGQDGGFSRYNIADPYGFPLENFKVCYGRIQTCLLGLFSEL